MYTRESAKRLFGKGHHKLIDELYDRLRPEQIIGIKPGAGRIDLLYKLEQQEQKAFGFESRERNQRSCVRRWPGVLKRERMDG